MIHLAPVLIIFSLALPVLAQQQDAVFLRAYYLEVGQGDYEGALEAYVQAAKIPANDARTRSRAYTGAARCAQKLGRKDEALKLFGEAVKLDPNNAEAVKGAKGRPQEGEEDLQVRVADLINRLGTGQREVAVRDLRLIGKVAIPQLEKALASTEAGRVAGAAKVLRSLGDEGWEALARALAKKDLPLPNALVTDMEKYAQGPNPFGYSLAKVAVTHASAAIRIKGHQWVRRAWGANRDLRFQRKLEPLIVKLLADNETEVLRNALNWSVPVDLRTQAVQALVERATLHEDAEVRQAALRWLSNDLTNDVAIKPSDESQRLIQERAIEILESGPDQHAGQGAMNLLTNVTVEWTPEVRQRMTALILSYGPDKTDIPRRHAEWLLSRAAIMMRKSRSGVKLLQHPEKLRLIEVPLPLDDGSNWRIRYWREIRIQAFKGWNRDLSDEAFTQRLRELYASAPDDGLRRILFEYLKVGKRATREILADALARSDDGTRRYAYEILSRRDPYPTGLEFPFIEKDLASRNTGWTRRILSTLRRRHGIKNNVPLTLDLPARDKIPSMEALQFGWSLGGNNSSWRRQTLMRLAAAGHGRDAVSMLERGVRVSTQGVRPVAAKLLRLVLKDEAFAELMRLAGETRDSYIGRQALPSESSSWTEAEKEFMTRWIREIPDDLLTSNLLEEATELGRRFEKQMLLRAVAIAKRRPHGDWGMLQYAVNRITGQDIKTLLPAVVSLLDHPNDAARKMVREALEALQQARRLRAGFDAASAERRARAIDQAAKLLWDQDPTKRRGGALALAALGATDKVPDILKLLGDADVQVRESALKALERLGAQTGR